MTEAEAKTKACPYARNFGASQQVSEGPGPFCVGSVCMAWRWAPKSWLEIGTPDKLVHDEKRGPSLVAEPPARVDGYDHWTSDSKASQLPGWTTWRCAAQVNGYCGQAGQP